MNRGIYPWFWGSRYHYDPISAHQRWVHRGDRNWAHNFNSHYVARVNGTAALPPRTLAAQRTLASSGRFDSSQRMVHSLADARRDGMRLQAVSQQQHARQLQSARTMVNQARNLSQSAPRVSAASQTRSFNRDNSFGAARFGIVQFAWLQPGVEPRRNAANHDNAEFAPIRPVGQPAIDGAIFKSIGKSSSGSKEFQSVGESVGNAANDDAGNDAFGRAAV